MHAKYHNIATKQKNCCNAPITTKFPAIAANQTDIDANATYCHNLGPIATFIHRWHTAVLSILGYAEFDKRRDGGKL